jgi:uncharacterized protein YuzE
MKTEITSTSNPPMVELRLSNAPVASEVTGDVIADLNKKGNWIRGLEVLGSVNQFSLQKALASLSPEASAASVQQPQDKLTVTYDKEADAGFLYLPYPESVRRASPGDPVLLKCSYSVEDKSAVFGLDGDGALVFVRFKVPDGEQLDSFMELFGSQE